MKVPRAIVLAALLVTACGTGPSTHTIVITGNGDVEPLPVTLTDQVGIVNNVGEEFGNVLPDIPVTNFPGRPEKVRVAWTGGSCDRSVAMELRPRGSLFALSIHTEVDAGPCDAMGIGREVVITFTRPVNAASIQVEQR